METNRNHTHKFCMTYCLHVNYKQGYGVELWGYVWQI